MNDATVYAARRRDFRALHREGCFLLPNPWDIGGARRLERLGFRAIASSSSACALALGRMDYQITLAEALDHLHMLVGATQLPVNADFENGFAAEPERVADNVRSAILTGIAGLSIEDRDGDALYETARAVERVAAARQAIAGSGQDVLLVARTEAFLQGQTDPRPVFERLLKFAAAGADCLYAPGVKDMNVIRDLVRAVAPMPVNVLLYGQQMTIGELAAAGVRRVSLGGALAGAAWRAFDAAASQFLEQGILSLRP
jgi:2-methylisocitrate lyase-like PEP mutase family enzyme